LAQLIAHDPRPGVICWHVASSDDVAELEAGAKGGRPKAHDDLEVVHAVMGHPGESQRRYIEVVCEVLGCGHGTAVRMLKACVEAGWLREVGDARFRRYEVTREGAQEARKHPSVHDWQIPRSESVPE
jgi:hypothetical protein